MVGFLIFSRSSKPGFVLTVLSCHRYAKHKGGTKATPLETEDTVKARCAEIFKVKWRAAAEDATYQRLKAAHQRRKR